MSAYDDLILGDNPTAYWPLDDAGGLPQDLGPNNYDVSWVYNWNYRVYSFWERGFHYSGKCQNSAALLSVLAVGNLLQVEHTDAFSFEGCFQWATIDSNYATMVGTTSNAASPGYRGWELYRHSQGKMAFRLNDHEGNGFFSRRIWTVPDSMMFFAGGVGEFHVAVTYDGSGGYGGMKLYINGFEMSVSADEGLASMAGRTILGGGTSVGASSYLQFGSRCSSLLGSPFQGSAQYLWSMSRFAFYRRVLTPEEVYSHFEGVGSPVLVASGAEPIREIALKRVVRNIDKFPTVTNILADTEGILIKFDQEVEAGGSVTSPPEAPFTAGVLEQPDMRTVKVPIDVPAPKLEAVTQQGESIDLEFDRPVALLPPTITPSVGAVFEVASASAPDGTTLRVTSTINEEPPPSLGSITAAAGVLRIPFSPEGTILSQLPAAAWAITSPDGALRTNVVRLEGSEVVVETSEQRQGATYTLTIPAGALIGPNGKASTVQTRTFTGSGAGPAVLSGLRVGEKLLLVTFSEPVQYTSAMNPFNYSVSPALRVRGVEWVSPTQVRLYTERHTKGVTYTVTVTGVLDLAGNSI